MTMLKFILKLDVKITKGLQNVVSKNELIKEVYFDEDGNYYFNKYEVVLHTADKRHNSTGVKKVISLGGTKQSVLHVTAPDGSTSDKKVITSCKEIYATYSRKEILDAQVSEEEMNPAEELKFLRQLKTFLQGTPDALQTLLKGLKTA